jgi:hypothetical protein
LKNQSFLVFDSTTLANYKNWAQGVGTALTALGYTKTADTGQVIWANVVALPGSQAPIANGWNPVTWTGGTAYTGVAGGSTGTVTAAVRSGLTYACIVTTTQTLSATTATAIQNTNQSLVLSAVANASSGLTVYTGTITGGGANAFAGFVFVITGFASGNNNGTFICTASTTTTLTLSNSAGTAVTAAGTATSSSANEGFVASAAVAAWNSNALNGHSLVVSGFTGGNTANNGTFTVIASHGSNSLASAGGIFGVVNAGVTVAVAGATTTENTPPESDPIHWTNYNYEVWQFTDASASTNPFFFRFVYSRNSGSPVGANINYSAGTSTTGTGFVSGQTFTNAGAEFNIDSGAVNGQGSATYECNFSTPVSGSSLSMMMWRDAVFTLNTIPFTIILDRAKDNFGSELDAYVVCLTATSGAAAEQILYKPGTGGTKIPNSTTPWSRWSVPNFGSTAVGTNNNAPVLPVFPVGLGYLATPCLGAIVFKNGDCVEGSLIPVFMYGAAHVFLVGKGNYTTLDQGSASAAGVGIRWE